MKYVKGLVFLLLVHCGFEKIETACGCEKREERQYLITAQIRSEGGFSEGVEIYTSLLDLVERERREIYGICLENGRSRSERIIFCSESRREYEEVEERFVNVNFRSAEVEDSVF